MVIDRREFLTGVALRAAASLPALAAGAALAGVPRPVAGNPAPPVSARLSLVRIVGPVVGRPPSIDWVAVDAVHKVGPWLMLLDTDTGFVDLAYHKSTGLNFIRVSNLDEPQLLQAVAIDAGRDVPSEEQLAFLSRVTWWAASFVRVNCADFGHEGAEAVKYPVKGVLGGVVVYAD